MRLVDLLRPYEDGLARIIDETPVGIDVRRHLFRSEAVDFERVEADATGRIAAGTMAITALGPDPRVHGDPEAAAELIGRLETGGRAIILFGWEPTELPYHRILDALTRHSCQVLQVAVVDLPSVMSGAVVERVEALLAPRNTIGEPVLAGVADADPLAIELRMANELAFGAFVTRAVRAALESPDETAERRLGLGRAQAERQIKERDARIAALEKRVKALESSTSYRIGGTFVRAAKSPRGLIRLPVDLWRIWRGRGP